LGFCITRPSGLSRSSSSKALESEVEVLVSFALFMTDWLHFVRAAEKDFVLDIAVALVRQPF
jgi:hypothetical protein